MNDASCGFAGVKLFMRFRDLIRSALLLAVGVSFVFASGVSETAVPPRGGGSATTSLAKRTVVRAGGGGAANNCSLIFDSLLVTDRFAYAYDSLRKLSYVFTRGGASFGDSIIRHEIDAGLHVTTTVLPMPPVDVWCAVDLDRDGQLDLVVQRTNPSFSDGWLEIYSAPDWRLRARMAFPGMTFWMYPTPVNVDADSFLEIYATPSGFGPAEAVIIHYDPVRDTFAAVASAAAPPWTFGESAVGDFDGDGRVEFITGNDYGYGLFEYDGRTLSYISNVLNNRNALNQSAVACRPKPDGALYALLASSGGDSHYRAWLLRAVADNSFEVAWYHEEPGGGEGSHHVYAADIDCDGLDELFLNLETTRVWEWDEAVGDFVPGCTWERSTYGMFKQMQMTDFDQDGNREWSTIPDWSLFRTFEDSRCRPCCPCHGDPLCDGVITDVFDVIACIGVAFGGAAARFDPSCPRERTDVDCSGVTDVLDVVHVIAVAFQGASPEAEFCAKPSCAGQP